MLYTLIEICNFAWQFLCTDLASKISKHIGIFIGGFLIILSSILIVIHFVIPMN